MPSTSTTIPDRCRKLSTSSTPPWSGTPTLRAPSGDKVEAVLTRMGELQAAIAAAPARRLKRGIYERRLLTSALAAVEAAAVRGA